MTVPGSNLFNTATRLIARQKVDYYAYQSRTSNEVGKLVATFAAPVAMLGSFQPVNRNNYQYMGLDLNKTYAMFYVSGALLDIQRDVAGDQIGFNGERYQCEASNPWDAVDGWVAVLMSRISPKGGTAPARPMVSGNV